MAGGGFPTAGGVSANGPNFLTATTLPWLGSTFRARATGMPTSALVLAATGFSTVNLPLPTLLPVDQTGCSAA